MMQPWLSDLHAISLVAHTPRETHETKEMMQPCLIVLHAISLVARAPPSASGREGDAAFPCAAASGLPKAGAFACGARSRAAVSP